ncbi:hypothetical protein IWW38_002089, partial [Coemansia aciculifera]
YKVVEYLEGRSRNSFDADMTKHNEGKAILAPLLSVGPHWYAVAIASICDNCLIKFDYDSESVRVTYPAWPTDTPRWRLRKNHLAKWVIVSVPLWGDMCDGKFCDVLTRPEYEGVVFRSATILELHLNKDTVQAPTSASSPNPASTPAPAPVFTKEQVVSFARSVRSLTPAATCVTIAYEFVSDSSENASDLHSTLVTELYRGGITRMGIYSITGRSPLLSMTMLTGLTSIVQG